MNINDTDHNVLITHFKFPSSQVISIQGSAKVLTIIRLGCGIVLFSVMVAPGTQSLLAITWMRFLADRTPYH